MAYNASVRKMPPFGLIDLRVKPAGLSTIEMALGAPLPRLPYLTAAFEQGLALALAPNEWLLRKTDGTEGALAAALRDAAEGRRGARGASAAITIVSDAYEVFEVAGPQARDVLCQATGIDLSSAAFPCGSGSRVRFAKAAAVLHHTALESCFHIYAPRSYAEYAWRFLDAAWRTA